MLLIGLSSLGIIDMNYNAVGSPITKLSVKDLIQSDSTERAVLPSVMYRAMPYVAASVVHPATDYISHLDFDY